MPPTPPGSDRPDAAPSRRRPGEPVVLRELWRGRVWYARPAIVVADEDEMRMFFVPAGVTALVPVDDRGEPLRLYADRWSLVPERRGGTGVLSFAFPETPYAVILGYDGRGGLLGFYVNLQAPLVPTPLGFDTVEHVLDATIAPDRSSWAWKDEDELAEAVARGIFTDAEARSFRAWGRRAVARVLERRAPFDREWAGWRPDPSWDAPALPPDATATW
jgi:predicted RNA-binding protein associated with RNAse of E/G family